VNQVHLDLMDRVVQEDQLVHLANQVLQVLKVLKEKLAHKDQKEREGNLDKMDLQVQVVHQV